MARTRLPDGTTVPVPEDHRYFGTGHEWFMARITVRDDYRFEHGALDGSECGEILAIHSCIYCWEAHAGCCGYCCQLHKAAPHPARDLR